jgi:potassium efflux system protein
MKHGSGIGGGWRLARALALLAGCAILPAQDLDLSRLSRAREAAAQSKVLSEAEKKQVLDLYDSAIASVQTTIRFRAARLGNDRKRANIEKDSAALQEELARRAVEELPPANSAETAEQARDALENANIERQTQARGLAEISKSSTELAKRREAINQRRAKLRQDEESADDQLVAILVASPSEILEAAARAQAAARKQAIQMELDSLDSEREMIEAARQVLPLRRDATRLRLEAAERKVALLDERSRAAEARDYARNLERAKAMVGQAVQWAGLRTASAEAMELAARLWGPSGVLARRREISDQAERMQQQAARAREFEQALRRRYEAAGRFSPTSEWLQRFPADMPRIPELRILRRKTMVEAGDLRRSILQLEERRQADPAIETQVERARAQSMPAGKQPSPGFDVQARQLLQLRRDLIEDLLKASQDMDVQVTAFEESSLALINSIRTMKSFAWERVFWARSASGAPTLGEAAGAVHWLAWNREWRDVFRTLRALSLTELPLALAALAILVLLVRYRRRLGAQAGAGRPWRTVAGVVLPATGMPGLMLWIAWLIDPDATVLGRAVQNGLAESAVLLFVLLAGRRGLADGGVADRILNWPESLRLHLARDVRWMSYALPPAWFAVSALVDAGGVTSDDAVLQGYSNSMGRLLFVGICLCFTVVAARLLHPRGALAVWLRESAPEIWGWKVAVRRVWACLLLLLPAALAVAGYYATALLLAVQFFVTAVLTGAIGVFSTILTKWRESRKCSLVEQGRGTPQEAERAELQVRRMGRFTLMVLWAMGMMAIWSASLPAISLLDEVKLTNAAPAATGQPAKQDNASQGAAKAAIPLPSPVKAVASATGTAGPSEPLTLLDLLKALAVAMVMIVLVKNTPGLLDFVLPGRMHRDAGAVYAAGAITRYLVILVGITAVSSILGINWSQVQWLVAALTFGIGFGLQEIFANFAAGLILLFDRTIRVGDAVSLGELSGRVSRIQMRATTVTLWDRSEMVVPNKEFITTKLVNWTLSIPESRVDLKVGVAYGSDLDLVRKILYEVAAENTNVLKTPPAEVLLTAFADSAVAFELRVFCMFEFGRLTLLDQLHTAVYRRFDEHGIEIAFPQLDVHLRAVPEPPRPEETR